MVGTTVTVGAPVADTVQVEMAMAARRVRVVVETAGTRDIPARARPATPRVGAPGLGPPTVATEMARPVVPPANTGARPVPDVVATVVHPTTPPVPLVVVPRSRGPNAANEVEVPYTRVVEVKPGLADIALVRLRRLGTAPTGLATGARVATGLALRPGAMAGLRRRVTVPGGELLEDGLGPKVGRGLQTPEAVEVRRQGKVDSRHRLVGLGPLETRPCVRVGGPLGTRAVAVAAAFSTHCPLRRQLLLEEVARPTATRPNGRPVAPVAVGPVVHGHGATTGVSAVATPAILVVRRVKTVFPSPRVAASAARLSATSTDVAGDREAQGRASTAAKRDRPAHRLAVRPAPPGVVRVDKAEVPAVPARPPPSTVGPLSRVGGR